MCGISVVMLLMVLVSQHVLIMVSLKPSFMISCDSNDTIYSNSTTL